MHGRTSAICVAVTHGHGNPAPCMQQRSSKSRHNLCWYHEQMRLGYIQPEVEPTTASNIIVRTADTNVIIGSGAPRVRKRKS